MPVICVIHCSFSMDMGRMFIHACICKQRKRKGSHQNHATYDTNTKLGYIGLWYLLTLSKMRNVLEEGR